MKRIISLVFVVVLFMMSFVNVWADDTRVELQHNYYDEAFAALNNNNKNATDAFVIPEFYYGSQNYVYGDYGSIKVGSYNAGLYGDERRYDATLDKYIDMEDAAPMYTLYSGIPYIPDHNYQGFDETITNDELFIYDTKGVPTRYIKVSDHACYGWTTWITEDGLDIYEGELGVDLITQTCIKGGVSFGLWVKAA